MTNSPEGTSEVDMHDPPSADQLGRFERLFTDHRTPVTAYLRRRTANPADVDDLVAETFMVVWRRLDDVPAGTAALPWTYAVARRVLANHRRREDRHQALTQRLAAAPARRPAEDATGTALASAAWHQLPGGDREVLSLAAWEGLDVAQIAVVLGCSRNAVRIRLHRARRRFEQLLAGPDGAMTVGRSRAGVPRRLPTSPPTSLSDGAPR